jgi:DNA modification methylase
MKKNIIYNQDCYKGMKKLPEKSIDLTVTSPPYFNARDYSSWETFRDYMADMKKIFNEVYRTLKNHKVLVLNVGDIVSKGSKESMWAKRKYPLGSYFTTMLIDIGFEFVDDYIWNKGEPQSKRHLGNPPYPFYQYPINVYEHILVFHKHELDKTKIPCPVCGETITYSNSQTEKGVQSWECKNPDCSQKSPSGRGKRFSKRSIMMNKYQKPENKIDKKLIKKWRKDIVGINPVIKINSKKENLLGHTAPFPMEIPNMAINFFSGIYDLVNDPFMGSGTTAISAIKNDRKYIGFELNKEYYDLAKNRIEQSKN